jgi:U3 small nucleolar RNA-associated protein 23
MIQDSNRFKMDLVAGLERTLHGKVKPSMQERLRCGCLDAKLMNPCALVITQCSIRHLYDLKTIPHDQKEGLVHVAKQMERRRCNHHTLEKPLSTLECLASVIDPKNSKTNKNRYVIASQEDEVRKYCRGVKGVPLVYVKRSVMVMEPMADSTASVKEGIDRGKFRIGLRGQADESKRKRKRADDLDTGDGELADKSAAPGDHDREGMERRTKKKRIRGPKGPNPLSVKKPRKRPENAHTDSKAETEGAVEDEEQKAKPELSETIDVVERSVGSEQQLPTRKKRKRKHKPPLVQMFGEQPTAPVNDS